VSVEQLQLAHEHGLLCSDVDKEGNTLAHLAMARYHPTKAMIEWWVKNRPDDLLVSNAAGGSPLGMLRSAEQHAMAEKMLLKRQPVSRPASKPTRLRL
jgi:hypothetical protein